MSCNTVSSTYHIWLYSIATDMYKILAEKQEETETLQMEIISLNVQLMEREESRISQLMEEMKGK